MIFRLVRITLCGWLIALLGSCANETTSLSASVETSQETQDATAATAKSGTAAPPIADIETDTIPAPKEWPKCWLSARLSSIEAIVKKRNATYARTEGRQEFRGKSANPITDGDCVLNWFGQDNPDEPWISEMQHYAGVGYEAVVTCTADATPACTCMSVIPTNDPDNSLDNLTFLVGNCVRESDAGRFVIYNVRDPQRTARLPANESCVTAASKVKLFLTEKIDSIWSMEADEDLTLSNGDSCRVDIEPFAPRADEQDWYGDAIRDWAVITCEEEDGDATCRSYALFYKSGEEQDSRGQVTETGLLLHCSEDKCQQVWKR